VRAKRCVTTCRMSDDTGNFGSGMADAGPAARRRSGGAGKIQSPEWRKAIKEVPRHTFTPDVLRRDPDGTWYRLDTDTEHGRNEWLDRVYSNTALLTATTDTATSSSLRSSSSIPGLMTRMLEALDIQDGHRVLEIGTGTGYNPGC